MIIIRSIIITKKNSSSKTFYVKCIQNGRFMLINKTETFAILCIGYVSLDEIFERHEIKDTSTKELW